MSSNDNSNTEQRERTKTVMLGADITNEIRAQLEEQKDAFLNETQETTTISDDIETNIPDSFFYSVGEALEKEAKRSNYEKRLDDGQEIQNDDAKEIDDFSNPSPKKEVKNENMENNYNVFAGGELIEDQEDKDFFSEHNYSTDEIVGDSNTRTRKDTEKLATNIISDLIKEPKIIESPNTVEENDVENDNETKSDDTETHIREKNETKVTLKQDLQNNESAGCKENSVLYGFLISYDNNPNGEYFELKQGKLVITNKTNPSVNCLTIENPSVSFMHAVLNVTEKNITLLDQFSENGTKIKHINDENFSELSGTSSQVYDKDVIMFGDVSFKVCLI